MLGFWATTEEEVVWLVAARSEVKKKRFIMFL